jgi:hypothetical protein
MLKVEDDMGDTIALPRHVSPKHVPFLGPSEKKEQLPVK